MLANYHMYLYVAKYKAVIEELVSKIIEVNELPYNVHFQGCLIHQENAELYKKVNFHQQEIISLHKKVL